MEKLQLKDFTKYKFLSGISFSPDGKNCGFIVHKIDIEENKYLSNIYILNDEEKIIRLTNMDEEKSFIWDTNTSLLFPAVRNKKDKERKEKGEPFTIFYEISINGGEAQKAFEIPLNVTSIKKLDEDSFLLTAAFDPRLADLETLPDEEKEKFLKEMKEKKSYEILDEIPFWSNGDTYTNKKRNRLYKYNKKDNSLKKITDEFTNVEDYEISHDKKHVVYITASYIDKMHTKTDLNIYNIIEDKYEKISPFDNFRYDYCDFLNDNIVFIGSDMKSHGLNENPHIYITDFTGNFVNRISNFDSSTWNSVGSDCRYGSSRSAKVHGDYLYFTTTEGPDSFLNRIDINGNIEKLTAPNGSVDGFDVIDDKIYFIGLRELKLQEIYSLNNKQETQLTNFNTWVNEKKKLSNPERVSFTLENGKEVEGWVLKPVNFEKGRSYPGILNIHGGPKSVYGKVFYHEMQYLANEGYFVFYCNPRGSDGYGNEFSDIRGKYGTIDYDDIMDFTDLILMNYPEIDKDRIGVTGGSYGGFMTNWIIGHTSRFKAAVSQRSISNWVSFFGTSDIGYYFADDQIASTPWNDIDKMWTHSPLKYANNVITPTLFIHSDEDYRCWIPEGLQMFTALKYHGVESRFIAFKGENHELSRSGKPKNRIKRLEEITAWFNKYLK